MGDSLRACRLHNYVTEPPAVRGMKNSSGQETLSVLFSGEGNHRYGVVLASQLCDKSTYKLSQWPLIGR